MLLMAVGRQEVVLLLYICQQEESNYIAPVYIVITALLFLFSSSVSVNSFDLNPQVLFFPVSSLIPPGGRKQTLLCVQLPNGLKHNRLFRFLVLLGLLGGVVAHLISSFLFYVLDLPEGKGMSSRGTGKLADLPPVQSLAFVCLYIEAAPKVVRAGAAAAAHS